MRINQVQLDLIRTDVRAVSASIGGTGEDDVDNANDEMMADYNQEHATADLSKFTIPDNDWGWVDMDDFVELGWVLPAEHNPETQILPLAFAPRFTYFRQTDHADNISGDPHRTSPFGNEPTHHCVMSARNDPRRVQCYLIEQRLQRVKEQIAHNDRAIGDQELKIVREPDNQDDLNHHLTSLQSHANFLKRKLGFLESMHQSLIERLKSGDKSAVPNGDNEGEDEYYEAREEYGKPNGDTTKSSESTHHADYISDFNNRFIIHNVHLKWNNSLRNIILRYIHQVSQRRGFVYYMSRRAVKFILDIVEEQDKLRKSSSTPGPEHRPMEPQEAEEQSIESQIQQLLSDGKKFVEADNAERSERGNSAAPNNAEDDIALDYVAQNAYIVRLIAPQIQLQSEKNTKAAVLVTAKGMQLKVIQIMDKDRVMDDVSGLVQRRFTASMDSLQIFVTDSKQFRSEDIHMYSGSTYGAPAGSAWPPWVPFEVMFDFHTHPYGFQRVVQRTSASMRLDKYNALRLKYNDDVSGGDTASRRKSMESRIDHIWVDFPHIRALCNSRQYYAMYIIVIDLLLYNEPLEKTRNERLEKIMLASDFSNLSGAPEMVIGLQERIRQLEEIKTVFQINEKFLDKKGWNDRIEVEKDLAVHEDELFFVMKAITTAQRRYDDRAQAKESTGSLRWYITASEIVWHLLREGQESLAEFQIKNALFDRTDNNDGSNLNSVEIEHIVGLNLMPNAIYPKMISPYLDASRPGSSDGQDTRMLKIHWVMLEAIAGIPVVDHFEINLFPLKVALEWEIGKKLFEYVFPGIKDKSGENGNGTFSPLLVKHMAIDDDDDDDIASTTANASFPENGEDVDALKLRLTPTLHLPSHQSKADRRPSKARPNHHLRLFRETQSRSAIDMRRTLHPSSAMNTPSGSSTNLARPGTAVSRTNSGLSVSTAESDRTTRRFALHRAGAEKKAAIEKKARNDDLTQMMDRASNYMTLAYARIPSLILCLSYKGKGNHNFEDIHDLVFKLPTLEYRNKTCSNLDLVLQLKRDVIRALISHAGAIVGNKFSHHRPSKHTQSRLRQIANSSSIIGTSPDLSGTDTPSIREHSPNESDASGEPAGRRSFASGRAHSTFSALSEESSIHSSRSNTRPTTENGSILGGSWRDNQGLGIEVEDGRTFADELSRVDQTEPGHAGVIGSLSRHVTQLTPFGSHRMKDRERERERLPSRGGDGSASVKTAEEEDDGHKKKSKFGKLLGRRGS